MIINDNAVTCFKSTKAKLQPNVIRFKVSLIDSIL